MGVCINVQYQCILEPRLKVIILNQHQMKKKKKENKKEAVNRTKNMSIEAKKRFTLNVLSGTSAL
jgi:hypothetical protein